MFLLVGSFSFYCFSLVNRLVITLYLVKSKLTTLQIVHGIVSQCTVNNALRVSEAHALTSMKE